MEKVKDPEVARRIARAVVSDIALYNAAKMEEGIKNDSLFHVLKDEIEEGRLYFENRVDQEIVDNYNLFERALVDILVKQAPKIPSKMW